MGNGYLHLKRATRYFEIHRPADVLSTIRIENWWGAPAKLGATHVITHPEIPDQFTRREDGGPAVSHFPYEQLVAEHGRYFTSSFAWLVAYALTFKELTHLSVYGLDMSLSEYATQKAGFEHYMGIAIGRGIKVAIPACSLVMRAPFLYALETEAARHARSLLGDQRATLEKEVEKHLATFNESQNARSQTQARMAEHAVTCDCAKGGMPCARLKFLQEQLQKMLTDEIDSSRAVGQFRARIQEHVFLERNLLIPTDDDIDRTAESHELPKWAEPRHETYDMAVLPEPGALPVVPRLDGQLEVQMGEPLPL